MTTLTPESTLSTTRRALIDALDVHVEMLDRRVGHPTDHRAAVTALATALAQIAEGTYGTCLGCGAAIDPDRLGDDPAISTCTACAPQDRHLIG